MLPSKQRHYTTKLLVGFGILMGSTLTPISPASAACQAGQPGCVLPVPTAAPPPTAPPPPPPVIEEDIDGGGIGLLPILLGLAALGGLAALLLLDDDDEEPVSP